MEWQRQEKKLEGQDEDNLISNIISQMNRGEEKRKIKQKASDTNSVTHHQQTSTR